LIKAIRRNLSQILLFIFIGALSAVVEVVTFRVFSLDKFFPSFIPFEINYKYPFSNFASSLCGILFNYVLSIKFVFKQGKHSKKKEFKYFIIISLFSMVMTYIVSALLQYVITFDFCFILCITNLIFCKIIAIALVSVLNYIVKKKFIFHE